MYAADDRLVRGRRFRWSADYDDAAKTIDINVELVDGNEVPLTPLPGENGGTTIIQNNGQPRTFDFFALGFVNSGPQHLTNVNLRIRTNGRNQGFDMQNWYTPPT
jgi:hypothetical protein